METQPKRKILLIDDDSSLLVTLSDFFKFEGYDVATADSGEQGLKRLRSMTPDLIILDMSMPGMGGVGFLKEISSEGGVPKYPVLVLTARANMAEFFANVDVDGFVAKPCDPEDLLMEVGRIIFLRSGAAVPPELHAPAKRHKMLLAEDDPVMSESLQRIFSQGGYIVNVAVSGPEALERAIVERPDVIVLKLVLTSMNGDAVARMLGEMPNTKAIPVVLYDERSYSGAADRYSGPETNVDVFVPGGDVTALLNAVAQVLSEE